MPIVNEWVKTRRGTHRGNLKFGSGLLGDLADEVQAAVLVAQGDIVPQRHGACHLHAGKTRCSIVFGSPCKLNAV